MYSIKITYGVFWGFLHFYRKKYPKDKSVSLLLMSYRLIKKMLKDRIFDWN